MGDAGDDRIHRGKCDDTLIGGSKGAGASSGDDEPRRWHADTVAKDLDARIDTVAQTLVAVAKDVSFLAGRQSERDRATEG